MAAYSLEDLIAELKNPPYTPKSQEQMQAEAAQRYQTTYDQLRLAAEQGQQRSDLALQQQAGALERNFGKQLDLSQRNYRQALSQADRRLVGRGMQRSSYGQATLGNIAAEGNKAANELSANLGARLGDIEAQRTLGQQQLGAQLQQYSASQQNDILSYLDQLANQEYQRQTDHQRYQDSLAAQLYQFSNQQQQQALEQQRWSTQFDEGVRQFNAGLSEQQKARTQSQEQWLKQFEESVRQNDTKLAEQIRQFNAGLSLDEKKLSMSADQWERQFAESVRQFDLKNPQGGGYSGGLSGGHGSSGLKLPPSKGDSKDKPPRDAFTEEVLGGNKGAVNNVLALGKGPLRPEFAALHALNQKKTAPLPPAMQKIADDLEAKKWAAVNKKTPARPGGGPRGDRIR